MLRLAVCLQPADGEWGSTLAQRYCTNCGAELTESPAVVTDAELSLFTSSRGTWGPWEETAADLNHGRIVQVPTACICGPKGRYR